MTHSVVVRKLNLAGHILLLPEERPARVYSHELGTCFWQTKTRKTTEDMAGIFKEDLRAMGVTWRRAKRVASDCILWKKLVAQCSRGDGTN